MKHNHNSDSLDQQFEIEHMARVIERITEIVAQVDFHLDDRTVERALAKLGDQHFETYSNGFKDGYAAAMKDAADQ